MTTEPRMVSMFRNKWDNGLTKEGEPDPKRHPDIQINEFLDGIKGGRWKQQVENVRAVIDDKAEYDKRKSYCPGATIWGTFIIRKAEKSDVPSGLMAIDLDHLTESEIQRVFNLLKSDPFVFAAFRSIGGKGLCVIFRVDYYRWLDSFEGIRIYLTETYGLVMGWDASVKDICRLRFVSYDPETYTNYKAQLFKKYPRKEKKEAKPRGFAHTPTDIRYVLDQIHAKAVDLTGSYEDWFRIGWALISEYGEEARGIFHEVSGYHPAYDADECDKKFNYLVATRPHSIKIATFYYYCHNAGLDTSTPQSKKIISSAAASKRSKITKESAIDTVVKMLGADAETAGLIVNQVYDSSEEFEIDETLFDQLEAFLKTNYSLRKNEITHYIENYDIPQKDEELNDIYIAVRKAFDEVKISQGDVNTLLHSSFVGKYHPIKAFFAKYRDRKPEGVIDALADTIKHDMGELTNYVQFFLRKFLVGMIANVFGGDSPLTPILTGPPNTGKTQFWRRLLPTELKAYYAESKFVKDGDDEMLMCKRLLLMADDFDNEFLSKHSKFKSLTSKQIFTLRKPYGKAHEDYPRLAAIAGTSNEKELLNDPTGNRRIIPIHVLSIDHVAYNAIDKIDLIMEAYWAYQNGERPDLTAEHIEFLAKHTGRFEDVSTEHDMVEKYFTVPTNKDDAELLSQGEILVYLRQMTGLNNLKPKLISQEMKRMDFPYSDKEWYAREKKSKRGFWVYKASMSGPLPLNQA